MINKAKIMLLVLVGVLMLPDMSSAASATLTWNANTEQDLAGYKIYRGNGVCSQGPLQPLIVNGSHVTVTGSITTYTDNTVPMFDGELCYELTAFDVSNNESVRSSRATKVVNLIPPVAPTGLVIGNVVP